MRSDLSFMSSRLVNNFLWIGYSLGLVLAKNFKKTRGDTYLGGPHLLTIPLIQFRPISRFLNSDREKETTNAVTGGTQEPPKIVDCGYHSVSEVCQTKDLRLVAPTRHRPDSGGHHLEKFSQSGSPLENSITRDTHKMVVFFAHRASQQIPE